MVLRGVQLHPGDDLQLRLARGEADRDHRPAPLLHVVTHGHVGLRAPRRRHLRAGSAGRDWRWLVNCVVLALSAYLSICIYYLRVWLSGHYLSISMGCMLFQITYWILGVLIFVLISEAVGKDVFLNYLLKRKIITIFSAIAIMYSSA